MGCTKKSLTDNGPGAIVVHCISPSTKTTTTASQPASEAMEDKFCLRKGSTGRSFEAKRCSASASPRTGQLRLVLRSFFDKYKQYQKTALNKQPDNALSWMQIAVNLLLEEINLIFWNGL
uniref:Uncharacterized protein n=1 Tax=Panagrellus redivivus TaxID=6233 RepID=A0A7E4ZSH4_PANRE